MRKSLREKINRDDGKYYQVGNHDLNAKEIFGYTFLILAMLVYLIVEKLDFPHVWAGWLFLLMGVFFLAAGVKQNGQRSNT